MSNDGFFQEQMEQSAVKAQIVKKYFAPWARIMVSNHRKHGWPREMMYVDLFCGPGRYKDGSTSTPLMVVEEVLAQPQLHDQIHLIFNDRDPEAVRRLRAELASFPGVKELRYAPALHHFDMADRGAVTFVSQLPPIPGLFFLDPFGYRGLTMQLINAALDGKGSECLLFFNLNAIRRWLSADSERHNMMNLFGRKGYERLQNRVQAARSSKEKDRIILGQMEATLKSVGAEHVLNFRFLDGNRRLHSLIHACKHPLPYKIMKDIMANMSSISLRQRSRLGFDAADVGQPKQGLLFASEDLLAEELIAYFAGQSISVGRLFQQHHLESEHPQSHYRDALKQLEKEGRVQCDPPAGKRNPNTIADDVTVMFPPREGDGENGTQQD